MQMNIEIRAYVKNDVAGAICIWHEVVQDGIAFPQMELLTESSGDDFFSLQSGIIPHGFLMKDGTYEVKGTSHHGNYKRSI